MKTLRTQPSIGLLSKNRGVLVTVGLILICVWIGWMLISQVTLIEQAHSEVHSSLALSGDITALRAQMSHQQISAIQENFTQAQAMLVQTFDDLTTWLHRLDQRAAKRGLRIKYQIQPIQPDPQDLQDVGLVPISLEVWPDPSTRTHGRYQEYLQFLRSLAEDSIRVDVAKLTVLGGKGARQMNLDLHVWIKQEA